MRVRLSAAIISGLIASGVAVAQQQPDLGVRPVTVADTPYTFDTAEQHGIRVSVVVRGLPHPFSLAFLPNGDALVAERSGGVAARAQRRERQGRGGDARGAADRRHAGAQRAAHERLARPRVASEVCARTRSSTSRYNKLGEVIPDSNPPGRRQSAITVQRGKLDGLALTNVEEIFTGEWSTGSSGSRLGVRQRTVCCTCRPARRSA